MTDSMDGQGWKSSQRAKRRMLGFRPAIDAGVALVLFVLISVTLGSAPTSAFPQLPGHGAQSGRSAAIAAVAGASDTPAIVEIATTSSPQAPDAIYRRTSSGAAWLLLCLTFSLLIAFNLAMLRHMRRVYVRRRGRGDAGGKGL